MKTIPCLLAVFAFCIANAFSQAPSENLAGDTAPSPGSAPATSSNYVLQPTDAIQVIVYREADLTTVARLSGDGCITFPLIGQVALGGKTVQQAQETIRKLLATDYLVNPQVTITVVQYTKRYFTVLGQVQHPGAYALPGEGDISLLQAIGIAGGFTRIAKTSAITVKRKATDGKETVIKVDAKKIATQGSAKGCPIQAGDIIDVPESMF